MADLPIVCTLPPDALAARREGLLVELLRHAKDREMLPEGVRLAFEPTAEAFAAVAWAVDAERHCCRFLCFTITVEANGGPIILELHGPTGTRAFLATLLEM